MPVTAGTPAPYAPSSAILEIVKRYRNRGLPTPITAEVLGRAGISESLIPRTSQALKTLDLIDEDGKPTSTLEGLRLAPEADYQERVSQWLNNAYADVLSFVVPATATETELRDAFRPYTPVGQQSRMVSLFTGLFREAGIGSDATKEPNTSALRARAQSGRKGSLKIIKRTTSIAGEMPMVEIPVAANHPPAATAVISESKANEISDKALEYKLVDLMKDEEIGEAQRNAIWTLIQYLTAKAKKKPDAIGASPN